GRGGRGGEGGGRGAGLARRCRRLAGARLHAERRPPRRRRLSLAGGGGSVAPLPARNVFGRADAGGRAMNEFAGRTRGAVHAAVATTAPLPTSPARRATSMTFRSCRERWNRP